MQLGAAKGSKRTTGDKELVRKPRSVGKVSTLILGIIVAAVIVSLIAIISLQQSQQSYSSPIPEIKMIYDAHEYTGGLLAYTWKGSGYPPPNEHPHYNYLVVNVTKGSEIEFVVKNGTSPAYYAVTVSDTLLHPPLGYEDAAVVMDNVRLNGSKMTVEFGKSSYFVQVMGVWITFDLSGRHEDHVTYGFMVREK